MKNRSIQADFGYCTIDPRVARIAAKAVAINATDAQDALMMLDMLGLIEPDVAPISREEHKIEAARVRKQVNSDLANKRREAKQAKQLKLNGSIVKPSEIGE